MNAHSLMVAAKELEESALYDDRRGKAFSAAASRDRAAELRAQAIELDPSLVAALPSPAAAASPPTQAGPSNASAAPITPAIQALVDAAIAAQRPAPVEAPPPPRQPTAAEIYQAEVEAVAARIIASDADRPLADPEAEAVAQRILAADIGDDEAESADAVARRIAEA